MMNGKVSGVRSIELGVRDLQQSADFYTKVWALEEVAADGDSIHLRATGGEHHVLTIRERPKSSLAGVNFAAPGSRLGRSALRQGQELRRQGPGRAGAAAGRGGRRLRLPLRDARTAADEHLVGWHAAPRRRPRSLAPDQDQPRRAQQRQHRRADDVLHRRARLQALRQHAHDGLPALLRPTITASRLFRANGPSLNHVAYEVPNIDGLMRGTGRLKQNGFDIEWGVGRHGPGNNVFSYFIEPDGFVAEYTTELDQIDEATHVPQDAPYWDKVMPHARRPLGHGRGARRTACNSPCRAGSISASSRPKACAAKILSAASSAANRRQPPDERHCIRNTPLPSVWRSNTR